MIGIYKITSPSKRVYIGQSVDVEQRFSTYKGLRCKGQPFLYNSFVKHGFENHIFEIKEECSIESLNERERHWQDYYDVMKLGLNCRLTTANDKSGRISESHKLALRKSNIGKKRSPETLEKQRIAMTGKKHTNDAKEKCRAAQLGVPKNKEAIEKTRQFNLGKKRSPETIEKVRQAHLGKKHTPEHIEKCRLAKIGQKRSDEAKKNMSIKATGRIMSLESIEKGKLKNYDIYINQQTGIFYIGLNELSKSFGISTFILKKRINNYTYIKKT